MATKNNKAGSKAKAQKSTLDAVAKQLLDMARDSGVEQNYFFTTTYERYETQLELLRQLKDAMQGADLLIAKEYVKGRPNLVANPAISEYNKTATAANQTASTLLKIIRTFASGGLMSGGSEDEGDDCDL